MADWQEILKRGGIHFDKGEFDQACALAEQGLRLNPHAAMAFQILGMVEVQRYQPYKAIDLLNHALALEPDLVPAHCQLGVAYNLLGQKDSALKCFETVLRFMPAHVAARFNRAQIWLQEGKFHEGWLDYEWRWNTGEVARPNIPRPRWDGRPLQGRSILVHTEQGMGDTIQFLRFLSLLKRQGARVVLACQKPLHQLLKSCKWVDEWFPIDEEAPINFDWCCAMLSLPGLLGIDSESDIPNDGAYVYPEPERVEQWRSRIESLPGLKIGLNWQGKPSQGRDRVRSIPLELFAPIAQIDGITLVSLHKGSGEDQIERHRDRVPLKIFDGIDADGAFVDTAAIMTHLDLILSTDTSTVHLAGALHRPVWVPISTACDWRFMYDRTDSPWYPTMRLFRQMTFQVWEPVIEEIATELRGFGNKDSEATKSSGA